MYRKYSVGISRMTTHHARNQICCSSPRNRGKWKYKLTEFKRKLRELLVQGLKSVAYFNACFSTLKDIAKKLGIEVREVRTCRKNVFAWKIIFPDGRSHIFVIRVIHRNWCIPYSLACKYLSWSVDPVLHEQYDSGTVILIGNFTSSSYILSKKRYFNFMVWICSTYHQSYDQIVKNVFYMIWNHFAKRYRQTPHYKCLYDVERSLSALCNYFWMWYNDPFKTYERIMYGDALEKVSDSYLKDPIYV